jgi:hypothetical protein
MSAKSPLKAKPLRVPGESLDEEIDRWQTDNVFDYLFGAGCICVLAGMEWFGYLTNSPRRPILFSGLAVVAVIAAVWRLLIVRRKLAKLRLGRDGERVVGQFLERLREGGSQVFHDIPGNGFNLDHVVISPHGLYAIETKTWSKPWPKATINVEGDTLRVAGRIPDCNPIEQVTGAARWLECELEKSTGKRFTIRGVVVFPGWFIDQRSPRGSVWVLEPKMLPGLIEKEPSTIAAADVALASYHLSRYVRSAAEKAA